MKKLLSVVLAVLMMPAVAFAENSKYTNFMDEEVAELKSLLDSCAQKGIYPEYETASYNILKWYTENNFMLSDEKKMLECEADSNLLCGKGCTEDACELRGILAYNEAALTDMYTGIKENLANYIAGTKTPEYAGTDYDFSDLTVEGGILRDKNKKPVFSVGYSSTLSTSWDLKQMSDMGSTNAVVGKPLSQIYTKNVAKDWVTQKDGTGENCTYTKETSDGNSVIKIIKTADTGSFVVRQSVPVDAGKSHTLSFYVKGTNIGLTKINIYDSDTHSWFAGKDISEGTFGNNWKEESLTFTPNCSSVDVEFLLSGSADELYIDDASLIKTGTGVNLIKNPGFEEDATTNINKYWFKSVLNALKQAKEGKTTVSFILSPHYFPTLAGYENDKSLYAKDDNGEWKTGEFIKFNINHPKAKEVLEDYLRTIGQILKDDPNVSALSNIVLTNESAFNVRNFESFYIEDYQNYLSDLYNGDIGALNEKWGTSYSDFTGITYIRDWCSQYSSGEYDTIRYNQDVFTRWHKWMADILKEYLPDVEISAKVMSYIDIEANPYWQLGKGTDLEKFNTFSDLAGNDAYTFSSYSKPVDKDSFAFKMMWYDFLYSITGKPSYNSEDHIIAEGDNRYSAEMKDIVRADLWQGALHGRAMSSVWDFSTHDYNNIYDTDSTNNYLFSTRPDVMEEVAHTGFDLRKYGNLLEKFNTKAPDVAILYSESSRLHVNLDATAINGGDNPGSEHLRQIFKAYKGAIFAGAKVGFVSENETEKLSNYKILVVPQAEHTTDKAVEEIQKFINNGGTVVLANNCFIYDEYHNEKSASLDGALSLAADKEDDYLNCIMNLMSDDSIRVVVKDNTSSGAAESIEWNYYADNGKVYVCLMNYEDAKNISVYINGEKLTSGYDLLSRENIGDAFVIEKFEPMMVEFDLPESIIGEGDYRIYDLSVNDSGKITWKVSGSLYYKGVEVFRITSAGREKVCDIRSETSFSGTNGETYEIVKKGEADGIRITVGDKNTFTVSSDAPAGFGGYYTIRVLNMLSNPAHGVATMIVYDEDGNIYKRNSVEFTAGKNETREIVYYAGGKANSIEFLVYDNRHSKMRLSDIIEYTK